MNDSQSTPSTHIVDADLRAYSLERLTKELEGIQNALDMLFTMHNSLEGPDLSEGGGSPADQESYQKLDLAERAIVKEINKRHMLEIIEAPESKDPVLISQTEVRHIEPEEPQMDLGHLVQPPADT